MIKVTSINNRPLSLLLGTNNAFRIVTKTYLYSEHTIDFCVVSLHGIVRYHERVSQAYETSVSKKRLHTKRKTLHFVLGNEHRFPLLLRTNNALRIFMALSKTKSALVIKISQRYCLLTVWNSNLFNICFFGRLDFFFSGDTAKISGNMTQVSGDMTSGGMTLGRLDCKPLHLVLYILVCNCISVFIKIRGKKVTIKLKNI